MAAEDGLGQGAAGQECGLGLARLEFVHGVALGKVNFAIGKRSVSKNVRHDGERRLGFRGQDLGRHQERIRSRLARQVAARRLKLFGDLLGAARLRPLVHRGHEQLGKPRAVLGISGHAASDSQGEGHLREPGPRDQP